MEASNAGKVEVRLYENIVDEEKVFTIKKMVLNVNPNSLTVTSAYAYVEPELLKAKVMTAISLYVTVSSAQISMTCGREHRYLTALYL